MWDIFSLSSNGKTKRILLFLMTFVEDKINILEAKKEWEFLCCLEGKCGISVNIRKTSRKSCWKTDLLMIFRRCISNIISVLESHLDTLEEAKPGSQGMKCLLLHQSIVTCILPLILRSATYNSKSPKKARERESRREPFIYSGVMLCIILDIVHTIELHSKWYFFG